jgi:alpha-ribazole phosphatase
MKAVLIRHSKTEGNLLGRYIGTTDEPLCPEGVDLLLKKKYPSVEFVYVSPMKRCRETASLIYPGVPQIVVETLKECDFGEFENKNYRELSGNPAYQAWVDSGGTLPFPKGESREAFTERCQKGFLTAVEDALQKKAEKIGIVAHGGTIMSILSRFAKPEKSFYDWQVKNGRGILVEIPETFLFEKSVFVLEEI